jgi:hypothetical protein
MMPGMWPGMFPGMMPGMGMPMMPAFNPAMFNLTTTHGNATEMFQAGMPGYINHVYVAPVMHQTIGDVSDGGDDFGDAGGNSSTSGHNSHVYSMDSAKLVEFETQLAEEREKIRGFKSKIHAASAAFKRERLQYEEQLRQKDQAREEILDQLRMLQSLIHSAATEDTTGNSESPEYEDEEEEEGKEGNPKILNLMLNDAPAIAEPLLETHHQEPESRKKRKAKKAKKPKKEPKKPKKEPSL